VVHGVHVMVRIVTDRHQDLSQRTVHRVLLKLVLNPKPVTIAKVHLVNGVAGQVIQIVRDEHGELVEVEHILLQRPLKMVVMHARMQMVM